MKLEDRNSAQRGRLDSKCTSRTRICVLGARAVGKTAIVVRFLTRRYIGEYRSGSDFLYKKIINIDDNPSRLEMLDTSNAADDTEVSFPYAHVRWAEAFLVVYAIHMAKSFQEAAQSLETIQKIKAPLYVPIVLLANQCDLPHLRRISQEEGQSLALQYGCHFAEVSAADDPGGVIVTVDGLLREVRALQQQKNAVRQRRTSLMNVSRLLGSLIGRSSSSNESSPQPNSEHSPKIRDSLRQFFGNATTEAGQLDGERKMKTISTMPNMEIFQETQNDNQSENNKETRFKSLRALRKRPSFSL